MTGVPRILMNTWRRQGRTFGPVLRDMVGVEVQYVHAVQRAGADVLLAPPPRPGSDVEGLLAVSDGLLLIGGEDLAAEVSGADPATIGENASADRDRAEMALLRAALDADLPVLAICRGLQLLNVAYGGTLHGDIAGCSEYHPAVPSELDEALAFRHPVAVEPGTITGRVLGAQAAEAEVNSLHHQAVDRVGDGLTVSARTPDGQVEALELPTVSWCLGVQWHPELMPDDAISRRIFTEFVAATR